MLFDLRGNISDLLEATVFNGEGLLLEDRRDAKYLWKPLKLASHR